MGYADSSSSHGLPGWLQRLHRDPETPAAPQPTEPEAGSWYRFDEAALTVGGVPFAQAKARRNGKRVGIAVRVMDPVVHVRLRVSSMRTLNEVVDLEDHPRTSFQYGRAPGLGRVLVHGPHATSLQHPGSWCLIDRRGLIAHQVRLDWMDVEDPAFRGRRCREPDKVLTHELLSVVRRNEGGGEQ